MMNIFEKNMGNSEIENRCFLCRHKNIPKSLLKLIDTTPLPSSKQMIKTALQHLAMVNKIKLDPLDGELICLSCYQQIIDYDSAIVVAIKHQQKLLDLIESAPLEEMSVMLNEDIENMHLMDDINSCKQVIINNNFGTTQNPEFQQQIQLQSEQQQQQQDKEQYSERTKPSKLKYFENILHCPLCAMRFRSKSRLQKHIISVHKKHKCQICDFSHRNSDYVKLHMNIHQGRNEASCLYCFKQFSSKISTIRHMEAHIDQKRYQCDKCGLCFSQTTILYNHRLQHEAEEDPLKCDICKQMFKTKRTFRHHMLTHRPDRPRYCCDYCDKNFTEKYTLKVHTRSHPEAVEFNYDSRQQLLPTSTPEVANTIQIQSTTIVDTEIPVEEVDKYDCIICDYKFDSKEQMNKHMQKEHDVILKSMSLATNGTNYEIVNNEVKKSCTICGQMFGTQINLDNHYKHMHSVF